MLHAFMLFQSGIPVLYSGDEVGQVNDYTYKDNPEKAPDSRYIHRGEFQWDLVERINEPETVQNRIFHNLEQLEAIRAGNPYWMPGVLSAPWRLGTTLSWVW